jgi:hypothetical protein
VKRLGNKISKILKTDSGAFAVRLRFSDGSHGWVSLKEIFEKPKGLAAQILKGGLFDSCFLESGALAWPNGLELCPDSLRMMLQSQKKNRHSAA